MPARMRDLSAQQSAARACSSHGCGCTGRGWQAQPSRLKRGSLQAAGALFQAPAFNPLKLSVSYEDGVSRHGPPPQRAKRCYTLTHNDITGDLNLTIGSQINQKQISGWYTRLLRDEVTGWWQHGGPAGTPPTLHVHCHISGAEHWLAPPPLRNYIFRREMALVLDTFIYADRSLLKAHPELAYALVFVHFHSHQEAFNTVECWGVLGQRPTWQRGPLSMMDRLLLFFSRQLSSAAQMHDTTPWVFEVLSSLLPREETAELVDRSPDSQQPVGQRIPAPKATSYGFPPVGLLPETSTGPASAAATAALAQSGAADEAAAAPDAQSARPRDGAGRGGVAAGEGPAVQPARSPGSKRRRRRVGSAVVSQARKRPEERAGNGVGNSSSSSGSVVIGEALKTGHPIADRPIDECSPTAVGGPAVTRSTGWAVRDQGPPAASTAAAVPSKVAAVEAAASGRREPALQRVGNAKA